MNVRLVLKLRDVGEDHVAVSRRVFVTAAGRNELCKRVEGCKANRHPKSIFSFLDGVHEQAVLSGAGQRKLLLDNGYRRKVDFQRFAFRYQSPLDEVSTL